MSDNINSNMSSDMNSVMSVTNITNTSSVIKSNVPTIIMLIGLPGSGKTSYAYGLNARCGYHKYNIYSSDEIREEICGNKEYDREKNEEVFAELQRRVIKDLENGEDCIYDATNLNRKKRMEFLNKIKNIDCVKKAVLLLSPIEECVKRDKEGYKDRGRKVGSDVIHKMAGQFQVPGIYEGWDEITVSCQKEEIERFLLPSNEEWVFFSQDNPHHTQTLGEHSVKVYDYCITHNFSQNVAFAGFYHDIGKFYTKTYLTSHGELDTVAHYYGHENYGAYVYLCDYLQNTITNSELEQRVKELNLNEDVKRRLGGSILGIGIEIATLINWHMRPFVWEMSEKAREKDRKLLGDELYEEIMQLHEADVKSR